MQNMVETVVTVQPSVYNQGGFIAVIVVVLAYLIWQFYNDVR
jgi:hypothetical protein